MMSTLVSEDWVFKARLDRDPENEKLFCLTLDPSCIVLDSASLCNLSGWLRDVPNHLSYAVTGRRGLFDGHGVVTLEFNYLGVHIEFAGLHSDDRNFEGKFVAVGRTGGKPPVGTFNPEDGDTGTATGSQAQCPEE
jgi:hypothetical protein